MLEVRWSSRTRADLTRIAAHWLERNPEQLPTVVNAIRNRVNWIAQGRHQAGTLVAELPRNYRWYFERSYGYKIYYRVEGDPPEALSVITVRHGRERPLSPSTLRRYARP